MYPEGTLINWGRANLVAFQSDKNNPENEGFISYWEFKNIENKKLIFKQRLTKKKAYIKYKLLIKQGWEKIDDINKAA
tara:strand:+ start:28755 stop:28988 length:234 start_codon:yes stop_codon:yes gene_type:complete